ncbi:hypothetical protein [Erwinia aphidicola]|uniref:hypothetical protein n=1 Tax=Erwinia aphidicola TaxID=68334 RepID=UPI0030D25B6A
MDSRAQFEAWMKKTGQNPPYAIKRGLWEVWKASRAAIEIEPPKFIDSREALSMGRMVDYSNGFGDAMDAYEVSIKSVGISIKGESS